MSQRFSDKLVYSERFSEACDKVGLKSLLRIQNERK